MPQPREHAVPCIKCHGDTWEVSAVCTDCQCGQQMESRPDTFTCRLIRGHARMAFGPTKLHYDSTRGVSWM
jgi:hypothetical protein